MAVLDIIILALLIPFIIQGITKGFVAQITAIIAVILGVWASFTFMKLVCWKIQPYLTLSEPVLRIVSFLLILILVMVILHLIGKLVQKILKFVMLGWLDKLLGIVFAILKGLLLIGLLITIFDPINDKLCILSEETQAGSVLYQPIKNLVDIVFPYLKSLITQ